MKFIDKAKIYLRAGSGGNGCVSFRRERCVPMGGPDGGDAGDGASIVFVVDPEKETLIDFKRQVHFKAKHGQNGMGQKCHGRNAPDLKIHIPRGTQIWNDDKNILLFEALEYGEYVFLPGGKGGVGNARFVSSTNKAPKECTPGEVGQEMWVRLQLKVFADIGHVGFPNAGKSSLLKVISGSNTTVADYPFTTLSPQLGSVWHGDKNLVIADLPGIIKDAHKGKGLGYQFLGHVERCKCILHIIDISNLNAVDALSSMIYEIEKFSGDLMNKKQVVALNKCDLLDDELIQYQVEELKAKYDFPVFLISCVNNMGISDLLKYLYSTV